MPYISLLISLILTTVFINGCGNVGGSVSESVEFICNNSSPPSFTAMASGYVYYEDKEYGSSGFTGTTSYKAVRYADIEAVDYCNGSVLASGATGLDGSYSLSFPSGGNAFYVRVISSATIPQGSTVNVMDLSGAYHSMASDNYAPASSVGVNITVTSSGTAGGAFNILDVLSAGTQFVNSLSGTWPPTLSAFWESGNDNGTWYCTVYYPLYCQQGEGIYILGGYDSDEYDDDVILHEFGHFTSAKFSRDDSPGGSHSLSDNDLDLRLSWSEGWSDFFHSAAKSWLSANNPGILSTASSLSLTRYIDTVGTRNAGISFDFGNPGSSSSYMYSSNETAVAKVLIDLLNTFGMQAVWDAFASFKTVPPTVVNLEAFWDGWKTLRAPDVTEITSLEGIYGGRSIYYKEDSYEGDGSPSAGRKITVNGGGEIHYLFMADGTGDIDIIAFDATAGTHTIETYDLRNGADTSMTLLDTNGTTILTSNDNYQVWNSYPPNNGTALASKIQYNIPTTGTYYMEVKTSASVPVSAGRYGTYSVKVTKP